MSVFLHSCLVMLLLSYIKKKNCFGSVGNERLNWLCRLQALYTDLRFFESWFCAEDSSGFERVSDNSFHLLEGDTAGHISVFKILFSMKMYLTVAKG